MLFATVARQPSFIGKILRYMYRTGVGKSIIRERERIMGDDEAACR